MLFWAARTFAQNRCAQATKILTPRLRLEGLMAEYRTVMKTHDLPEGSARTVEIDGKLIAIFHHAGQYFAIDDTCPHMGASLAEGYVEDGVVTCPWHAWRFCLADGAWVDNPRLKIGCYPVRVVGDEVQLLVGPPCTR